MMSFYIRRPMSVSSQMNRWPLRSQVSCSNIIAWSPVGYIYMPKEICSSLTNHLVIVLLQFPKLPIPMYQS